jgi:hypothetical protein
MVRDLDSVAATPEDMRPRLLDEDTAVQNIAVTPEWTKYLDQTYNLPQVPEAKQRYRC